MSTEKWFPTVGDDSGLAQTERLYKEELQLALRNKGLPLEALRYALTPTGLHYLLVHYDIPAIEVDEWRLKIRGLIAKPQALTLEDIRKRPSQTMAVTMECAGNGRALFTPRRISQPWLVEAIGTSEWTGAPLSELLEEAGLHHDASEIVFTGLDRGVEGEQVQSYQRSLPVQEALSGNLLLAYEMNGEPLPPQHGYPLRLLVPGWYGMTSVKWLDKIEAVPERFQGYQMARAYRYAQSPEDPGEPVNLIRVRALMVPPGIPEFLSRVRLVQAGPTTLTGRAWAGRLNVDRVEVSVDSGSTWSEAQIEQPVSPHSWRSWTFSWNATPGTHVLCARATDSEGHVQPMQQQWNFGGYGNNSIQRVNVIVE